jgi:hypothetical protein
LIYDMFFTSPENSYLVERGTILVPDRNISLKINHFEARKECSSIETS